MKKLTIILFLIGIVSNGQAQKHVMNPDFDAMLQELLEHSVIEVVPTDILVDDSIIYLDARQKKEFEVSHIKGARWIGFLSFKSKRVTDLDPDQKIVDQYDYVVRTNNFFSIKPKILRSRRCDILIVNNLYSKHYPWDYGALP